MGIRIRDHIVQHLKNTTSHEISSLRPGTVAPLIKRLTAIDIQTLLYPGANNLPGPASIIQNDSIRGVVLCKVQHKSVVDVQGCVHSGSASGDLMLLIVTDWNWGSWPDAHKKRNFISRFLVSTVK